MHCTLHNMNKITLKHVPQNTNLKSIIRNTASPSPALPDCPLCASPHLWDRLPHWLDPRNRSSRDCWPSFARFLCWGEVPRMCLQNIWDIWSQFKLILQVESWGRGRPFWSWNMSWWPVSNKPLLWILKHIAQFCFRWNTLFVFVYFNTRISRCCDMSKCADDFYCQCVWKLVKGEKVFSIKAAFKLSELPEICPGEIFSLAKTSF